jgi:hypothetical protein
MGMTAILDNGTANAVCGRAMGAGYYASDEGAVNGYLKRGGAAVAR